MATCVLLQIVSDLIHDPALRQQFNQSPNAFMAPYNLTSFQRSVLLTMDRATIGEAIKQEIAGFDIDPSEFPACSEEYLPEGSVQPLYPDAKPTIFRFHPHHVKLSDLPGSTFELIVTGQSFAPGVNMEVVDKNTPASKLGVSFTPLGTYRCSRLYAIVGPPPGPATSIPVGAYRIRVINSQGSPNETILTAGADLVVDA
jgi:hypothetical protein